MNKDPWHRRKTLFSSPVAKAAKTPRVKWKVLPILWLALKRTCAVLGAFVLFGSILLSWTLAGALKDIEPQNISLPNEMVLYLDFKNGLSDLPKEPNFVDPFVPSHKTLRNAIDALEHAKDDPRVKGIYANLNEGGMALANLEEFRTALLSFRESGKFAYAFATSYDNGLGGYYLASAFDEIWMQPMGTVSIPGINAEVPFVRSVLDKIGVKPQFMQRKEYKNAYETFTSDSMSEASKRSTQMLLDDIRDVITDGVVADLGVTKEQFDALVDQGVFTSAEAVEAGLVDYLDYADNLVRKINKIITGDPEDDSAFYVDFYTYVADVVNAQAAHKARLFKHDKKDAKPNIALIYAVGAIMDTDRQRGQVPAPRISGVDNGIAPADKISAAIFAATDNENIDAIVLRIDSPGGSPIASETILRALKQAQNKGKKVIVSMGRAAASGGYWIASGADHIFAVPSTITGSIGVLGGKVSAKEMWEKLGVNWERLGWGENAAIWSVNTPFSKSEAERMNAVLDAIYAGFVERVSQGRKMSPEEVEEIARGRVWSGVKAKEIGLVDSFGGLNDALDYAAVQAGADDRHGAHITVLPRPRAPIEQFLEFLQGQVYAGKVISSYANVLGGLKPYIDQAMVLQNAKDHTVYTPIQIK